LAKLIEFIQDHSQRAERQPRVFFLGDIVDRGPDSRVALDIVCDTIRRWPGSRLILGNHDFLFRDALTDQNYVEAWYARGAVTTLASYLGTSDAYTFQDLAHIKTQYPEHLRALTDASLIEIVGSYAFVHAGIDPSIPVFEQRLSDCVQIRKKFLDHVGTLTHIVVHGHTPLDPPQPVVTENRISLDTNGCHSGVLSMAVIDTEQDTVELFSTNANGSVLAVEPICLDRGYGTVWSTSSQARTPPSAAS
jgi:serine/threonine protein phosphatase 1